MKQMVINKISKSVTAKNSIWMIVATVIQMFVSLFVNRAVAGYLDVERYGIINYSISFVTFFTSLCNLGLNSIIIKELINNKNNNGKIIGTSILMKLVASCFSILLLMILIYLLKNNDKQIMMCAFFQSFALLFSSFDTINLWYQSNLNSKIVAIFGLISYFSVALYKVILVKFNMTVYWFAFANSLTAMVTAILLFISYFKNNGQKLCFSFALGKNLLKKSYHFILAGLMIAIYAQTDKIMIGSMMTDISSVGLYSVATTIITLWSFIPNSIITAFNPTIIIAKRESNERYIKRIKQLYSIIIWLSIAYALFITIFCDKIILILYGRNYLPAKSILLISIWGVIFSFIGVVREIWLVNENCQKYSKWFALIGAITNIVLNFILIPVYGIIGAAIATFVTQLMTGLFANLFFKETKITFKYIIESILLKF